MIKAILHSQAKSVKSYAVKKSKDTDTVPDEAVPVKEIMRRANAQHVMDLGDGAFYLDQELDNINKLYGAGLDITDMEAHKKQVLELNEAVIRLEAAQAQEELRDTIKDKDGDGVVDEEGKKPKA